MFRSRRNLFREMVNTQKEIKTKIEPKGKYGLKRGEVGGGESFAKESHL